MLYDTRWDRTKIKADPRSLEGLTAWLEKQPAAGTYNWHDCKGLCLIGLYGIDVGMGEGWHDFHYDLYLRGELPVAADTPHTFSAALTRAREALASRA